APSDSSAPSAPSAPSDSSDSSDDAHSDEADEPGRPIGTAGTADLALSELLRQYAATAQVKGKRGRLAIVNLQKRLLSSVEAFARTIGRHARSVAPDLDAHDQQLVLDQVADIEGL